MTKAVNIVSFNIPYPPNYGGVIDVFFKIKALSKAGKINLITKATVSKINGKNFLESILIKTQFEDIKKEVDSLVGAPLEKPILTEEVIGVIKWVDGTILDSIFSF